MDLTTEEQHLVGRFRSLGEEARAELLSLAERMAAARTKQKRPHYRDLIGEEVVQGEAGQTEVRIPVKPFLLNRGGVVHGGVISTLMDEAIGWAAYNSLGEGAKVVTAELKINFLEAAVTGMLTGRGRVIRQGKHLVVGEGDILDHEGRVVAHGLGTWMILSPRP
ncbi:MAG: PaaI family thioesterase [Candidatus Methylomirabilales bacterium]